MKRKGQLWINLSVLSRAGMLVAIVLGALWPTYLNLLHAYNNPRIVGLSHGAAWESFYRSVGTIGGLLGSEQSLPGLFFGTPASMTLFGIPFVDPVIFISLLLTSPSAVFGIALGLITVAVVAVVLGRGYCSFGCPASLFFTAALRIREKIEQWVPSLYDLRRELPGGLRYGMLVGGTIAAVVSGTWVWRLLLPYSMVSTGVVNLVIGVPLGATFYLFVFLLLSDLFLCPGEFCRCMCPLGLVLGRMSRHAIVQVRAGDRSCLEDCENCLATCDLALDPREGAVTDCSLCGRCVPACPSGKLAISPGLPRPGTRAAIVTTLLLVVLLFPSMAEAHHYHGLPHYGYFDNYPQTPIEEYIASDGRWEMNFTLYNFQGMQRADVNQPDDVQIFIVIFDLKEKATYGGRAEITILKEDEKVAVWDKVAEQESIFLVSTQILDPDDLKLEVRIKDPEGKQVILSSPFSLPGEGGQSPLVWVGCGLILLTITMVFASKQKRPRPARPQGDEK